MNVDEEAFFWFFLVDDDDWLDKRNFFCVSPTFKSRFVNFACSDSGEMYWQENKESKISRKVATSWMSPGFEIVGGPGKLSNSWIIALPSVVSWQRNGIGFSINL